MAGCPPGRFLPSGAVWWPLVVQAGGLAWGAGSRAGGQKGAALVLFFVRSLSRFPLSLSQSPRCYLLQARLMLAVLVNLWPVPSGGGARCAAFSLASVALCAVLAVCVSVSPGRSPLLLWPPAG